MDDGGRLSFGRVLDLSGTSEPRIGGMDLSGFDSNTSHEDSSTSHHACACSPQLERAIRAPMARPHHRGASPSSSRALNLSQVSGPDANSSMLSNVPTVKRCITPERSGSPIQPLKLFGSQNGQGVTPAALVEGAGEMIDTPPLPHQHQQRQHTTSTHMLPPAPCPRRQSAPLYSSSELPRQNPFSRSPVADSVRCGFGGQGKPQPLTTRSFLHDFTDFKKIGTGCYGEVYSCTRKLDLCQYAVKEIKNEMRSERERERVLREIYALATQGDNVHVVRFFSAWEQDGKLYIQTELCEASLAAIRKERGPQPEPVLREILLQIAVGLAYMHASNVAHLDIKPENVYATQRGVYKIGDFGLATVGDSDEHDDEGDKRYLSWELLQNDKCDLFKADVFALGVTVYEMASAEPLPQQGEGYHRLRSGHAPLPGNLSPELQELLRSLLHPDPAQRPSAAQLVLHPLLHPLLRDESAACLRASPPASATPCARAELLEREGGRASVAGVLARALRAEKEAAQLRDENRALRERLALFQHPAPAPPPCLSPPLDYSAGDRGARVFWVPGEGRRTLGSPARSGTGSGKASASVKASGSSGPASPTTRNGKLCSEML